MHIDNLKTLMFTHHDQKQFIILYGYDYIRLSCDAQSLSHEFLDSIINQYDDISIYTYTHQTLVYNLLYNVIFLLTASIITMKQPYLLTVYRGCAISLINILLYEKKRKDDKESLELTPVH